MAQGEESNISKIVRVFVDQLQEAENAAHQTAVLRRLSHATAAQLDGIGDIVGEVRDNRDDATYRTAIYFRIFINSGNGEPETLISVLRYVTGSINIKYTDLFPATAQLTFAGETIPADLALQMQGVAPAGVQLHIVNELGAAGFVMDSIIGPLPDTDGLGFSSTNQIEGGKLSSVINI